jgi:hypothetical protein
MDYDTSAVTKLKEEMRLGSKKEFAIGVNDGRRHNLKRCRDFPDASESTESGRRYRLVLFVL